MRRMMQMLVASVVLAAPLAAQQGPPGGPGGRGGMGMMSIEELSTRLKLDESQKTKVKALLDKFTADTKGARETIMGNMQAVRNGETTREAVEGENQAAMMVVREYMDGLNKEIRTCLTPDQVKEFDAYLAERAQRMGNRRPPGR